MMAVIACGCLVGVGLFLLIRELIPAQPQLRDALERLHPSQLSGAVTSLVQPDQPHTPATTGTRDKIGAWIEQHLAHRAGFGAPTQDLEILGRTTRGFYGEKGSAALIGLIFIPLFLGFGQLTPSIAIAPVIPAGAGLAVAAVLWFLPDAQVKQRAADARAEFVRVTVAYLQLVAIKRSAGGEPVDTMMTAATISNSWVMVRIRQELTRAQWAGIQPWDALTQLADRIKIPEIGEVGDIMRLAGEQGATVREQLLARAAGLQHRLLSDEHTKAQAQTTKMAAPVTCLALVFILALLYPVVLTVIGS